MKIFQVFLAVMLSCSFLQAQTYDTSKLSIITGKALEPVNQFINEVNTKVNDNDGVGLTAGSAIFYSFHPQIRDSLTKNGIFMPVFSVYFGKHFSPFVEACGAQTKDNKGFALSLFQFSAGLVNQVRLTDRLGFRQKYAMTVLNVATENPDIPKHFGVGFMAGLGVQTLVSDKLYLYLDANYSYQGKQFSGIRFEPGLAVQF